MININCCKQLYSWLQHLHAKRVELEALKSALKTNPLNLLGARSLKQSVIDFSNEIYEAKCELGLRIELSKQLIKDKQFYNEHKLESFAAALPDEVVVSPAGLALIKDFEKQGFNMATWFPSLSEQAKTSNSQMCATLATGSLPSLPTDESGFKMDAASRSMRREPYVLFFSSERTFIELLKREYYEAEELCHHNGLSMMSLREYLVLHCREFKESHVHDERVDWLCDYADEHQLCVLWDQSRQRLRIDNDYPDSGACLRFAKIVRLSKLIS